MPRWRNWVGTVESRPVTLARPRSVDELRGLVAGLAPGVRVRMAGSGHSFTPVVATDQVMLLPHDFGEPIGIDSTRSVARIPAGMVLHEVNARLAAGGWALTNMGDITAQTVGGAISTSTHGTGLGFTGFAGAVVGFGLVTADGGLLHCSASENEDIWRLGRVGLGALGILTYVDMRVVPAFRLHAVEEPRRLDAVLERFDDIVENTDHFEFYWIPHTRWALTKSNTRTDEMPRPRSRRAVWVQRTLLENYAFGAVCALGRAVPALVPRLATALPSTGRSEFVEPSHEVFATRRLVKFHEMEYSIPRKRLPEALGTIVEMVDREGLRVGFPVEVRVTAADDVALSTSFGRESAYVAVHMYKGVEYERYFRLVEEILAPMDGRPHWGKIHFQGAETLRTRYPLFEAFLGLRDRLDPGRRFLNPHLERVLGC